ncbi:RHS repeat-associated protein [Comamonas sp. BIGb0152]|uniref:RHS repeat-associated core domain-containing protein n=1 Tax=Comamonas sp. BIGb0152 TaxID=2940601 RepID=UPI0021689908|nr:RHS repeat-associated core domain-containing protein [Comamonas sp. BIGb0152]MCS4292959.1 RHS repeat-associated protein [Comamonas sp. BIGb0152]
MATPNALIREDSRLDWAVQLDAWGNVRAEHNPADLYQPIRLPGQHADGETGLYYNRHRYYESLLGNYLNQDPIRLAGGFNIYAYPINPISFYDSIGLQKVSMGTRNGGSQKAALVFDKTYPQADLDIQTANTISLPQYDIGGAASGKKPWQELSPYEYSQYCQKWSKNKLSCMPNDREPGKDVKYPKDYIPNGVWKSSELPQGYSCETPYYFPEIQGAGSASTADFSDLADIGAKILRNRSGARK